MKGPSPPQPPHLPPGARLPGAQQPPRTAPGRGAHLHGKCLAAAGVLTHERAPLLVEREDMALEVEHGGVGAAAAFPGAPTHVPLRGVNSHMLLQEILALKRLLAHVTCYVLCGSRLAN